MGIGSRNENLPKTGTRLSWIYELLPPSGYSIYEQSQEGWKEFKITAGDQFRVYDAEEKEYFVNKEDVLVPIETGRNKFVVNDNALYPLDMGMKITAVITDRVGSLQFIHNNITYTQQTIIGVEMQAGTSLLILMSPTAGQEIASVKCIYEEM